MHIYNEIYKSKRGNTRKNNRTRPYIAPISTPPPSSILKVAMSVKARPPMRSLASSKVTFAPLALSTKRWAIKRSRYINMCALCYICAVGVNVRAHVLSCHGSLHDHCTAARRNYAHGWQQSHTIYK